MIGLIHKTLFGLIEHLAGGDAVAEVKRRAGVPADQVFRLDEAYDDGEWQRLLEAACQVLRVPQCQAEEAFADFFCRDALRRWPTWFAMSRSAREFLERHPSIHNSFATGVRDPATRQAIGDKFDLRKYPGELVMHYRSPNRLCGLYMALARWIIRHYGDQADVEETRCLKKGDRACEVHVRWPQAGAH
jgi:hypothetical protein